MNGELTELHDKIMARFDKQAEKQQERHEENIKKFGDLPCDVHVERMDNHTKAIAGIYAVFMAVLIALIRWAVIK